MRTMMFGVAVSAVLAAIPAGAQQAPFGLHWCSRKVPDRCQKTPEQACRAFTAAQADARDARFGGAWSPNHDRAGRQPRR